MCEQCVDQGLMTAEQAERQFQAYADGDSEGFLAPIMDAIRRSMEGTPEQAFQEKAARADAIMLNAAREARAELADGTDLETLRDNIAGAMMFRMSPANIATGLAERAVVLLLQEDAKPVDDDLEDTDPVDAEATRIADSLDNLEDTKNVVVEAATKEQVLSALRKARGEDAPIGQYL